MNVYQVSIGPKKTKAAIPTSQVTIDRTLAIVTGSIQDAMNIARTKITSNEEITGVYVMADDAIVDYSQVINATGGN